MTRAATLVIIALAAAFIVSAVVNVLRGDKIRKLDERTDVLELEAVASDVRESQLHAQLARDTVWNDSIAQENTLLRQDLRAAQRGSTRIIVRVDSIFATIDEDTLPAQIQEAFAVQREALAACRVECDLTVALLVNREAQLARIGPRLDSTLVLLHERSTQLDTALVLIGEYQSIVSPNFFLNLFREIPQMMACAGGGALVAELYDGKVLVGAGIGLAACLIKSAVFK